jgi:DNA-binding response OmpR family regulator
MGSSAMRILAISASGANHALLRQIVRELQWDMDSACSRAEAIRIMRSGPVPVIVCDRDLPDGTWKDILEESALQECPSYVIVTTHLAHDAHLWCEVLHLGGDEVLTMPFERMEVFHSISAGWRHWEPAADHACSIRHYMNQSRCQLT